MNIIRHKKKGILRGTGGYSLVELAVVIPITVIVAAGIYAVFNHAHKSSISQKNRNALQTSCTFAMDYIKNDLSYVGYRAVENPNNPITSALSNRITFEYWDDRAVSDPPFDVGYSNDTLVTYRLVGNELRREFQRHNGSPFGPATPVSQVLAENIEALGFSYFSGENTPWDGADRADIRTIGVSLKCAATREDPLLGKTPTLTLSAEVRARNIGVASSPADTTPPATPGDPITWDEGVCGRMQLRWPANSDADLAGYILLYGLAPGDYSDRYTVTAGPKAAGEFEFITLTDLEVTKYADINPSPGVPVTYYVTLLAYDQSGNQSTGSSAEVSGDPTGSSRTVAAGAANPDTTINALIPDAPTGLTISAPADNQLKLEWTKSPVVGLAGYRIYRSTDPSFIPSDDPDPDIGNLIASEATGLGAGDVSYTDGLVVGDALDGCRTYYYKIAAVACDNTLPIYDPSPSNPQMLYAEIDGETTDSSKPPSPTLEARPGYRRIILNFINPTAEAEPDFLFTKVWYNTSLTETVHPAVTVDSVNKVITVANGEALPPFENDVFTNERGTFIDTGAQLVNFNNSDVGTYPNYAQTAPPILQPCTEGDLPLPDGVPCTSYTFRFTAVSFDLCWNVSEITSASIAEGDMCTDDNGAAPAVTNLVANVADPPTGCYGSIQLDWDAIDPFTLDDLSGYHIWRCEGVDCTTGWTELTNDLPLWYNTWLDTTVLPGVVYTYRVSAADCYYEWAHTDLGDDSTLGPPTYLENLSVGRIEQDSSTSQLVTGYLLPGVVLLPFTVAPTEGLSPVPPTFRHDTVTLWVNNNSASNLLLTHFTASWLDPTALLRRVAFGDDSTTPVTIAWRSAVASPITSNGSVLNLLPGSLLDGADTTVPFVTRFNKLSDNADLREEVMEYRVAYRNDSTGRDGCFNEEYFFVPLGPYGYGTTQSQPTSGTNAWPVPGEAGNAMDAVVVPGGVEVDVYTNISDTSLAGIVSVKLYYYVDDTKLFNFTPDLSAAALYPNLAPYTAIDMEKVAGSQWRTPVDGGIPRSDDSNVWYFIVAVDGDGNFDRLPEIDGGGYQYFQAPEDPCDTTPNAPALSGSYTSSTVDLTWTAPTTNAIPAGTDYIDGAGFEIWRQRDSAGWTLLYTETDPDTLTYQDSPADMGTAVYEYYVTAFDGCADPSPKISIASNIFTELEEDPCGTTPDPPVLTGVTGAGGVDLTWTIPTTNTSGTPYTDGAGFVVYRREGALTTTLATILDPGATSYSDGSAPDLLGSDYYYTVVAFDTCATPGPNMSNPSNTYIDQLTLDDPCTTTPSPPENLAGVADMSGVTISWTQPTTNAVPLPSGSTPYTDGGGYEVHRWDSGTTMWSKIADISDPSTLDYFDSPADIGTVEYHYTVKAYDTCSPSPKVSAWHIPVYYEYVDDPCVSDPTAPASLSGSVDGSLYVNLSWPNPGDSDLAGYEIWRAKDGGGYSLFDTVSNPGTLAWTDTSVTGDITTAVYGYQVRSFDTCPAADGGPNYSPGFSPEYVEDTTYDPCTPAPTVPAFPASPPLQNGTPAPTCGSGTTVTITWPAATATVGDVILYEVWRCNSGHQNKLCDSGDTWDEVSTSGGIAATEWFDTLPAGDVLRDPSDYKYSYQVKAVNTTCASQSPQPSALSIIYAPCN